MDSHHLGRDFGSAEAALKRIKSKALVIGIDTDILFPNNEQEFIAEHIQNGQFVKIESDYGHDGFLTEFAQISKLLKGFLR